MTSGIFLIQDGGKLVRMNEAAYDSEDLLQGLLEDYPDLLAGDQMESSNPRRWLLVCREMGIPDAEEGGDRWSVDHLFFDQDAIPTLVEVKRSSDTRIRREVVGQMLDYAANAVVYWPVEQLRSRFERQCESKNLVAEDVLSEFLGESGDVEDFWQQAKTNLQAGKVRLVFVADVIPNELKRIVEFLNEQMDPAKSSQPFSSQEKRIELLRRLNDIKGVALSPDVIYRRPNIAIEFLRNEESLAKFIETMEWMVAEIRKSG